MGRIAERRGRAASRANRLRLAKMMRVSRDAPPVGRGQRQLGGPMTSLLLSAVNVVVAVPARDILAFCDVASLDGLSELRRIAAKITENGDHV